MRILIVGAGAIGGYLGACLTRGGRDVTYLVLSARAAQLAGSDLHVSSADGAFSVPARAIVAEDVLRTIRCHSRRRQIVRPGRSDSPVCSSGGCKYGHHPHAQRYASYGEPEWQVRRRTGALRGSDVLCQSHLEWRGQTEYTKSLYHLRRAAVGLGERTKSLAALLTVDGFEARSSDVAMQDMWEKWASIATMSSASGLMRAAVGDILLAPGGRKLLLDLLHETFAVATAAKPRPAFGEFLVTFFTTEGSTVVGSPLRDIERGATTEGEIIIGPYADRARALGVPTPLLDLARCHFAAYEARRKREQATA